ncbi:MAG: hypothetical protein K6F07_02745 [Bacilli bacterium]|nr:hypothetical protein [Bacilli bacterium]
MKNNRFLLTMVSLLLAGTLVACGSKNSNEPTKPDTPVEPDVPTPPTPPEPPAPVIDGWPEDFQPSVDATLEALGATDELPGIPNGDSYRAITPSAEQGEFIIDFSSAEAVTAAIEAYQENLLNADFNNIGADKYGDLHFTSPNEQYDVCAWDGNTSTEPGNFVVVDLIPVVPDVLDIEALLASGYTLHAGYPQEEVEWALDGGPIATVEGVNLEGDWYIATGTNSGSLGDYRYGSFYTAGLFGDTLAENLVEAGFIYNEEAGRYFSAQQEVEAELHEGEDYTSFAVYGPYRAPEWPAAKVAAIIESLVPGSTTVLPAIADDEITKFTVYTSLNEIDVKGPETLLEKYAQILLDNDWEGNTTDGFISPAEDIKVTLAWNSTYGLEIKLSAAAGVPWPAEQVAALVEAVCPGSTTVIPAIEGASKVTVYNGSYFQEIDVEGPASLVTDYAAILVAAQWEDLGGGLYGAPAKDIMVALSYSTYYGLIIEVKLYQVGWPAEQVAALLELIQPGTETVLPEVTGAGQVEINDGYVSSYGVGLIYVNGTSALVESYCAELEAAHWIPLGGDEEDGFDYASPAQDIQVNVAFDDYYGQLSLTLQAYSPVSAEWPAADIAAVLGEGITDVVPAFTGANEGFRFLNDAYGTGVSVLLPDGTTAESAIAAYEETLTGAGYIAFGNAFSSTNGQILVMVSANDEGIIIQFQAYNRVNAFPLAELNEFLQTYELGFQLTEGFADAANKGFLTLDLLSGSYHGFQISVEGNQTEAIDAFLNPILTAAEYSYSSSSGYYYNVDDHQVSIGYNESMNITYVNFWE